MSLLEDQITPSNDPTTPLGGEILAVANAATARAEHDESAGELVIVARTGRHTLQAVGGSGSGPLRAAVSVAVAAGNTRLWDGAPAGDTVEHPVRALPEIVRTTAEAGGVSAAHVGCVEDDSVAAVAVWFEIDGRVTSPTERTETMELLEVAAERQREYFAARAASQPRPLRPTTARLTTARPTTVGISIRTTRTSMRRRDSPRGCGSKTRSRITNRTKRLWSSSISTDSPEYPSSTARTSPTMSSSRSPTDW